MATMRPIVAAAGRAGRADGPGRASEAPRRRPTLGRMGPCGQGVQAVERTTWQLRPAPTLATLVKPAGKAVIRTWTA